MILIIDDEVTLASVIEMSLSRAGYESAVCKNGVEAIKLFSEQYQDIDLVLLDYSLPDMSGIDVLSELRRIDSNVLVIFSSGHDIKDKEILVSDILQKPFTLRELVRRIERVLVKKDVYD